MKNLFKFALTAALFTSFAVSDSTSFTIHVIGDSTVCNYDHNKVYPQTGWGQVLNYFFDGSRVKINNVAIGGRSSKKFINDGRLKDLEPSIQKGDYVFVQFGHNDRDYTKEDRYTPIADFPKYMQQYIDVAVKHGATPVLVSPMNMNGSRNIFSTGDKNYDARGEMEKLCKSNKIPFVDLNMKSYNTYNGTYKNIPDYVTTYLYLKLDAGLYPHFPNGSTDGNTHFQIMGSLGHCGMIVEELQDELSASYLSAESKAALTTLVSAIRPRHKVTVKANIQTRGLITQDQLFPAGTPMTLRVTPGNGETFEYWADDNCNKISDKQLYYGFNTPDRDVTYTAMYKGGSACVASAGGEEAIDTTKVVSSSSSKEVTPNADCVQLDAPAGYPSPIDMANPDDGEGTSDTDHTGYVGKGFYNFANNATSYATYKMVSDRSATDAKLMIRYAFAGSTARNMTVKIDAKTYDVSFPPTADWNTWDTAYVEGIWLDACEFDMVFTSTTADGGPNIDMVAFTNEGVARVGCSAAIASSSGSAIGTSSNSSVSSSSIVTQQGNSSSGDGKDALLMSYAGKSLVEFNEKNWTISTSGKFLRLQLMNVLGKVVYNNMLQSPTGQVSLAHDVEVLPKGRYFLLVFVDGLQAIRTPVNIR